MHIVETVLGNIRDEAWKDRLAEAEVDVLELSQWDAQKNRLRKDTRDGLTVAVSLERDAFLRDGDVLLWDDGEKKAVVCNIDLCDVLVVDLGDLRKLPPEQFIERCVQLGHALGNQHWPAVVQDGFVYVPLAVNRMVMNSVMNTHHFADISFRFVPGADIADKLDPSQARRLFGGTEQPMQGGHSHAHGHAHADGEGHGHPHVGHAAESGGDEAGRHGHRHHHHGHGHHGGCGKHGGRGRHCGHHGHK